jgi:hypothetical protein
MRSPKIVEGEIPAEGEAAKLIERYRKLKGAAKKSSKAAVDF